MAWVALLGAKSAETKVSAHSTAWFRVLQQPPSAHKRVF